MIERFHSRTVVHPGYSPEEGLWFTEYDVTAPSLRELQAKLPGALIEGYYPEGYTANRPKHNYPKEMQTTRIVLPSSSFYIGVRKPRKIVEPEPEPEPELDLEPGQSLSLNRVVEEVEEQLLPDQGVAEFVPIKTMPRYKRRGVPLGKLKQLRTASKHSKVDWSQWDTTLRKRLAAGDFVVDIAVEIGCSRNAVIGRSHRLGISIAKERGSRKQRT